MSDGINAGMRRQKKDLFIDVNVPGAGRICFSVEKEKATDEHRQLAASVKRLLVDFLTSPSDSATLTPEAR